MGVVYMTLVLVQMALVLVQMTLVLVQMGVVQLGVVQLGVVQLGVVWTGVDRSAEVTFLVSCFLINLRSAIASEMLLWKYVSFAESEKNWCKSNLSEIQPIFWLQYLFHAQLAKQIATLFAFSSHLFSHWYLLVCFFMSPWSVFFWWYLCLFACVCISVFACSGLPCM